MRLLNEGALKALIEETIKEQRPSLEDDLTGLSKGGKRNDLKVQYKQGSTWLLYSKYQKTGWTHSDTIVVDRTDGTKKAVMQTKWTQKGCLGLYELLKSNGVLPLIEQEEESNEQA